MASLLIKDTYEEVKARLVALRKDMDEANTAWLARCKLDGDDFYLLFHEACKQLFEV